MEFNNSRLQQDLTCPRSFKHRYLAGVISRKRPTYFVFGEAIHKFIEFYYRTADPALALKQVENVFNAVDKAPLNREETHDLECDKSAAMGIAEAYPDTYKQDFDQYKKFLTEQKFSIVLPTTVHKYFGTLDALLMDQAGGWWILETKTAAAQALNDDYFERVKIDSQVAGYMHGAKSILGFYPRGVVYNVIKKPSIRLKGGESLQAFQKRVKLEYTQFAKEKQYFQRQELLVATHRLDRWAAETAHRMNFLADRIEQIKRLTDVEEKKKLAGILFPMNTGACRANFSTCQFMNACVTDTYNKLLYEKDTSGK